MENLNEYGLSTVKDIPKWIARIPFFRRLWFNPVFQRNYRNSRVRKLIEPKTAFRVGLIWSAFLSVVMVIGEMIDRGGFFISSIPVVIIAPFGVIYCYTFIRMFFFCLITTPRECQAKVEMSPFYQSRNVTIWLILLCIFSMGDQVEGPRGSWV
jgi:hypothetical protein